MAQPGRVIISQTELQHRIDIEAARTAAMTTQYTPGAGEPMPRNAANIAWSEFNHHWAGAFVLLMAALALADRNDRTRWAQNWPLLFLPLAAFLAYRDLVEGGLHDGIGFFALPAGLLAAAFTEEMARQRWQATGEVCPTCGRGGPGK